MITDMAKKKTSSEKKVNVNAQIEGAGIVLEQPITTTLETNYLPYAMSVINSRALPEIDGFKPSHRKLLYTMYKMGCCPVPVPSRQTWSDRHAAKSSRRGGYL